MLVAATAVPSSSPLPGTTRPIPGSYGPPLIGAFKDRLDYFWFQGPDTFFRSRVATHGSTVFRTNMPPAFPFFGRVDPRVVAVADCAAFSTLFDVSLVDKRNVLVGDYMPSVKFTGNTRVVVYLDPTEQKHGSVKTFCLDLLRRSSKVWVDEFLRNLDIMLGTVEAELAHKGKANFFIPLQKCIFAFLTKSIVGADPSASPEMADKGFAMLDKWLAFQLLPTIKVGVLPAPLAPLEELLLHTFPLPFFLVSGEYRKLYQFVQKEGSEVVALAKQHYDLGEDEAINNILFVLGFNAFGGFSVFFPSLLTTIGSDKTGLQDRLRDEVRSVIKRRGESSLGFEATREMELVRSTVYEVLRMNPPVPLQFARARKDFVLRSHDAAFQVEKGELLCGYQPLTMRDPAVFEDPEGFRPDRFLGDEGKALLKYLYWSNGPETGSPTPQNKQCAAKDYVVETACLMLAEIFTRYDEFVVDGSLDVTKMVKATQGTD